MNKDNYRIQQTIKNEREISEHIGNWCAIEESDLTEEQKQEHCELTLICYDCKYNKYSEEEE